MSTTISPAFATASLSSLQEAPMLSSAMIQSPRAWFGSFARNSILSFLHQAITTGHLIVEDSEGIFEFGTPQKTGNTTRIRVLHKSFWARIFSSGDLGFSEAYMMGEVEVDNLKAVMDLWLDNQSSMTGLSSFLSRLSSTVSGLSNAIFGQTKFQARLNAIASYDQSNELFKVPSKAISRPHKKRKIRYVLDKARVKPGSRILEFGTGWGGLAIEAALNYGCEVDTLTLAAEQKALAEERIEAAGLKGRVRVHLMDYRDLPPEFEHAFDAFVSIEMLEHVGSQYYQTYFRLVDFALKKSNATAVVSASTFPESRYSGYQAEDFMRKYMWPNSCLPSSVALITAAHAASQGRFTLESVENHAAHYPRTLRTWGRRLESNLRQDVIAKEYPVLESAANYAAFKRKWEYLFAYAGAGFAKGYITCHMLTFVRENDAPAGLA